MPLTLLFQQPQIFIAFIAAILLGIAVHEYAHAYMAYKLGDDTAAQQGRLSLNPFVHIDALGLLFLVLVGFGWGKPVPVDERRLTNRRWGPLKVSVAGPLANVILAALVIIGSRLVIGSADLGLVNSFLYLVVVMNFILAVFNLLPIPPLDGSSILFALLPASAEPWQLWLRRQGLWLLIGLVILMNFIHWSPFVQFYYLASKLMGWPLN